MSPGGGCCPGDVAWYGGWPAADDFFFGFVRHAGSLHVCSPTTEVPLDCLLQGCMNARRTLFHLLLLVMSPLSLCNG